MRSLCLLLCLTTALLRAQPGAPVSLNRFPYIWETSEAQSKPLLNTQYYLSQVEPLPQWTPVTQLPVEFHKDPEFLNVASLYQEAGEALKEGDSDRAVTLMAKAVTMKPDEMLLKIMYADRLLSNKQYQEAIGLYEVVLKDAPTQYQCLNNLAWMLATVKEDGIYNPKRALQLSTQARLVNPNSHYVWSTLSEAQFQLGKYQEAEESMSFALELANRSGAPTETIISYLFKRDRSTLAREATSILE